MENTTIIQKLQAKKNKKGFTLVELVIVIAILAILAAIAIPVIVSTINSANTSTFQSDTATCGMLLKAAINEQKGKVGTDYTVDPATKIIADGTKDIPISAVASTNGFSADLKKTVGDAEYVMYWDGTDLKSIDSKTNPDTTGGKGYISKDTKIDKDGEVTGTVTTYDAVENFTESTT